MSKISFQEEKKLWKKGYKFIIGLDEAGRGALAGPVVAAAVMVNSKFKIQNSKLKFKIKQLKDSKKMTEKQRQDFYKIITKEPMIKWGIGIVSEKVIDKINILQATKLAMKKAARKIQNPKSKIQNENSKLKIDYLIIDGKMKLNLPIPQKAIVKADEKVFSCALASIIAKVTRDKIMRKHHYKYPQYGFDKHKGYCTSYHKKMLKEFGPCKIHRKTFAPLKNDLQKI